MLGLLLLISLLLISIGSYRHYIYKDKNHWSKCKALIKNITESFEEVALSEYSKVKYFYPVVTYAYKFNHKEHVSNQVSPHIRNIWVCEVDKYGSPTPDEAKFWYGWAQNQEIEIFVNPDNPSDSYIKPNQSKTHKSHNFAIIASGLLLFIIWVLLAYKT